MSNTLESLKKIANSSTVVYPFDDDKVEEPAPKKGKKKELKLLQDTPEKPKKRKHSSDDNPRDIIKDLNEKIEKYGMLYDDDFDDLLDAIDYDDENLELKAALVGEGRKYARANTVSESANEIDKSFAPYEQMIKNLLVSLDKDTDKLESDLDSLRGSGYNKNPMKTAELAAAKTTLHKTKLDAINKLTDITKIKFDLKAKAAKDSGNSSESFVTNNIMQQLFGMGHKAILDDMGGRDNDVYYDEEERGSDREIENSAEDIAGEMMSEEYDKSTPQQEGDIYLKYEGNGTNVSQILEYDTQKQEYRIHAEDDEGNIVPDYPIPKDPNELIYDINHRNNTATDQLQRHYKYREV